VGGLLVLSMGAVLVARGHLGASMLPVLTLLALASFVPVSEIAKIGKELADALASARRVFAVEDEPVPVKDGPGVALTFPANGDGTPLIQYEGVSFAYGPGEPPALRHISFAVGGGQTVALVGRSGSGKTTTVHMLFRFWDPDAGRILLGGHDLRAFTLDDLHRQIALVSQDTYLFNASVRENLRIGRLDATDAELVEAARQANAHEFIILLCRGAGLQRWPGWGGYQAHRHAWGVLGLAGSLFHDSCRRPYRIAGGDYPDAPREKGTER